MTTTEDRKEPLVYELGYLLLPSIAEDKLSDAVDAIKGILKKEGAKELDSEDPLSIDLAYTMSKTVGSRKYVVDEAYIGWVKFEADGSVIKDIEAAVKKLDEVLRFLLVKTTKETHFTFALALKAKEEKERALLEAEREAQRDVQAEPVQEVVE